MSEVRRLVHTLSLNSNGSSEVDSNEIREDEEITLEQAKAMGFGNDGDQEEPTKAPDQGDAWGFNRANHASPQNIAPMPAERDAECYNMNHRRRGLAIIFNHKNFDMRLGLKTRNGTDADRDNLRSTLRSLDFDVKVYNDLEFKNMEQILEEAALANHSDEDCILVAVLSHGELGILYAKDQPYKPDRLWSHFNAEKCPTLAGKPKLFFVQVRFFCSLPTADK